MRGMAMLIVGATGKALDNHRHPLAPRLAPLQTILAKLDPPKLARNPCRR
jgi:hypothetical protein